MKSILRSKRAVTSAAAVLAAIIFIGGFGAMLYGFSTDWTFSMKRPPEEELPNPLSQSYVIYTYGYDSLGLTSLGALGSSGAIQAYYFTKPSGGGAARQVGLYSSSGTTVTVEPTDDGYLYIAVSGNASYYVDANQIRLANSRVVGIDYYPIFSSSSVNYWVFQYRLTNIAPSDNKLIANFYLYALAVGAPTLTLTANVTSIGTSLVTKSIQFYATIAAVKQAAAIYKITLEVNVTSTSTFTIADVNIPGFETGLIQGTRFEEALNYNEMLYTLRLGTNFENAVYWQLPANILNQFALTTRVNFDLASDRLTFKMTVYYFTPSASGTETSASTTVTAECSA